MGKIDIGNVRGIQGEKGDKGERGKTPSYDDIKYQKQGENFVTLKGVGNITQSQYYLDVNNNLCDSEGHLYDNENNLTDEIGEPFNFSEYGYYYKELWVDSEGNFTNRDGELLNDNWEVQYAMSDFISDIVSFIFADRYGYNKILSDISPYVADFLLSADPNDARVRAFFEELEGDIKYYICVDNPKNNIYIDNEDNLINICKYLNDDGVVAKDTNNQYLYVPLEKNTLYLYNPHNVESNDIMLYDIYLCTKANTVPIKLVDSSDFTIDYNVIDDLQVSVSQVSGGNSDEKRIFLELLTRGTRGQFYSMSDVDKLLENNLLNKLGANSGIAQLNSSGKVPSSQLPAYVDEVVEGTMNSNETVFTPSNNESVEESGKIYVDVDTKKTYRWTGSAYVFISNPIVVDDDSTTAYGSAYGQALEQLIGDSSLDTSATTITDAINELNSNIPSDVSDLSDSSGIIPTDVSDLTDTQDTTFTPKTHTHSESDITDLTSYLETADVDTLTATITYTNNTTETVTFYIQPNVPL